MSGEAAEERSQGHARYHEVEAAGRPGCPARIYAVRLSPVGKQAEPFELWPLANPRVEFTPELEARVRGFARQTTACRVPDEVLSDVKPLTLVYAYTPRVTWASVLAQFSEPEVQVAELVMAIDVATAFSLPDAIPHGALLQENLCFLSDGFGQVEDWAFQFFHRSGLADPPVAEQEARIEDLRVVQSWVLSGLQGRTSSFPDALLEPVASASPQTFAEIARELHRVEPDLAPSGLRAELRALFSQHFRADAFAFPVPDARLEPMISNADQELGVAETHFLEHGTDIHDAESPDENEFAEATELAVPVEKGVPLDRDLPQGLEATAAFGAMGAVSTTPEAAFDDPEPTRLERPPSQVDLPAPSSSGSAYPTTAPPKPKPFAPAHAQPRPAAMDTSASDAELGVPPAAANRTSRPALWGLWSNKGLAFVALFALSAGLAFSVLQRFSWPELEVNTEPAGAEVWLDNTRWAHPTPTRVPIAPGKPHSVRLVYPGHRSEIREIRNTTERGHRYTLQVTLSPISGSEP